MLSLFEQETKKLRPLWPLQLAVMPKLRDAIKEGHRRIILQAPCGFGKTIVAAHIIAGALRKRNHPLFTCPSITLVEQTLKKFENEGIDDIGIMQAQHSRTNSRASVQIASVQTLIRRAAPDSNFALIDECHEEFDGLYAMLDSEAWKNQIAIGLSATPWAKGMGLRWTKLIIAATINDLIAAGHAVPAKIYGPEKDVERESVPIVNGEFEEESSSKLMSNAAIVGDVIKEWKAKSPQGKTFMFCVNRQHAQAQMCAFLDCGIPFGYIDANTPIVQRVRLFREMQYGEIAGISSVGCLISGVDEDVRCIIDLKLRKSEMKHVQLWGRGVRPALGKTFLLGLDHAGNNIDLGLFTDIYHDTLDMRKSSERGEAYKGDNKPAKPNKCPKCHNLVPPAKRFCPSCGERIEHKHNVQIIDGRLVEIGANYKASQKKRQNWYSAFIWLQRHKRFKQGWAEHRFQERFGAWPQGLKAVARKPSEEIRTATRKSYEEYRKAKAAIIVPQPDDTYHGEW